MSVNTKSIEILVFVFISWRAYGLGYTESCVQDLRLVWQNYQGRLPRNMPYDYDDCRSRTQKQLDFIRENGRPSAMPVVAADYNGKLKLFDGNHRIIAAWQSGFAQPMFKVWKGLPDNV